MNCVSVALQHVRASSAAVVVALVLALCAMGCPVTAASASPLGYAQPNPSLANDALVPPDATLSDTLRARLLTPQSGDYRIDALVSGYRLPGTTVTYSFYRDSVFGGAYYGDGTVSEVSDPVKRNARAVMAWYGSVMNVNFVEVPETPSSIGYIRFMLCDQPAYGRAFYPVGSSMFSLAGDVQLNPAYDRLGDGNGLQHTAGMWGYQAIVHEVGHAVGLKHPFEGGVTLPTSEDIHFNTTMSYTGTYSNYAQSPATPMAYDLLALHYMYGARVKNAGDDTYKLTSLGTSQYVLGRVTWQDTRNDAKQSIWDSGGTDTIDATDLPQAYAGYRFDLRGGGRLVSMAYHPQGDGFQGGTTLAVPFEPENFVNSTSNDTVYANGSANVFSGYTYGRRVGSDIIVGADSRDTIDLTTYESSAVVQRAEGSDLVLTLGGYGTIRVVGYYAGSRPSIAFATLGDVVGHVTHDGSPLEGAAVSIAGRTAITDVTGAFELSGIRSGSQAVQVSKAGYQTTSVEFAVAPNVVSTLEVALDATVYSVTYAAGENGHIEGETTQAVEFGMGGSPVTAVPDEGYHFVAWSDGEKSATRTETKVVGTMHLVAVFEIDTHALTYLPAEGGTIEGPKSQAVPHGSPGAPVVAVPARGYRFVAWSDGLEVAQRAEGSVLADATYTAVFEKAITTASIARSPSRSNVTYARSAGSARYTLRATVKGWLARPVANRVVYLQTSTNGSTWSSTYRMKTNAAGTLSKTLVATKKQVRYYRWYVPAQSGACLKTYSPATKVLVK